MRIVTEATYSYQKCSLQHSGLQHNMLLPVRASPGVQEVMQDQRFCKQDMFVSQAGLTQEDF